jgi:hypothetical protein
VVEDHIGFTGGATASSGGAAFSGSTVAELNLHANSFQLGDVTMFVNSTLELYTVDGLHWRRRNQRHVPERSEQPFARDDARRGRL